MPGESVGRAGIFKARPLDWSAIESPKEDSKAVRISIRYGILAELDTEQNEWTDWPAGYEVYGDHWVIGKEGNINEHAVNTLIASIGWSGNYADLAKTPADCGLKDCRIEVEEDTYEDKVRYRVKWLNPIDWERPAMRGLEADKLKALDAKLGSAMRALAAAKKDDDIPF